MAKLTLIQSLEVFAKKGEAHTYKNLWDKQITRLRNQGFYVIKVFHTGFKGSYFCFVRWENTTTGAALRLWNLTQESAQEFI